MSRFHFRVTKKKTNSRHEWKLEYEDDVGNFNIQKNLLTHLKRQTVLASRRFTCVGLMDFQLEDFLVQFHTWLQHKNVNQLQLYSTYTTSTSSRGLWAFFAAVCFEQATINEMWNDLPIKRRSFTVNWAFNMLNKHIFMLNVVFNGTARAAAALESVSELDICGMFVCWTWFTARSPGMYSSSIRSIRKKGPVKLFHTH